ncbi:unnamed protein product [Caenorhabditis auriculariae]|uniref:GDP-fucose protein O-fucosyltransferase 2 n=1 Tax=Caenorhabditis auriculariae TaxID=2777116 RepID=A0A8S1HB69_9PELO|nr:unnamed protein product [Caenorhabditis auriculariae]
MLSKVDPEKYSVAKDTRFLLFDVNLGEGFNLRRDVYMRVANTIRLLRLAGENFILVLPAWGGLYHWQRQAVKVPWGEFFDVPSLNRFVPVIELDDFLKIHPTGLIDDVVYLQHYAEGWGTEFVRKFDKRPCMSGEKFYKRNGDFWKGWFYSYDELKAKNFECVSIQGDSATLKDLILKDYKKSKVLFIDRAETILHDNYGDEFYWQARRSMRYSKKLVEAADKFRKEKLSSTDEKDKTLIKENWQDDQPRRNAKGGPFVCTHWRRRDFLRSRKADLPSINGTAIQLVKLTKKYKVKKIFLATDAPDSEVEELRKEIGDAAELFQFKDDRFIDGAIAIIDQWICSHAIYFTGSCESTFSFRIQEDREILGFRPELTFNRMCPDDPATECQQPSKWTIAF